MKWIQFAFPVICILTLCFCTGDDAQAKKDINPNGSSELALLMRDMFDDGMKMKEDVLQGKKVSFGCDYTKIHTASATEPDKVADPAYAAFASAYIESVDALKNANLSTQKEAYKIMVQNCVSCHAKVCPGPIRKIKKMEIPLEKG